MAIYQFSQEAINDLNEICNYLAQNNPRSASNLFDAIRQKCKLVANFPNMGKRYEQVRPNLRGFLVGDYIIFYNVHDDGIFVLRIVSGYRNLDRLFCD
ncbi:MAG: type II toxin-antitoxin system RelE/ParE family toxin [Microcystis sp.]|jgi:toxin ParE1/3/4|uniref:type II toxin-antitoxin system RelE/ParE family toxin n=1 Tax=unclassified Microcystis TaxID=2643300 RepID=UPI002585B6C7|nr:type II toxin-antitoxin system RelE/ParE family toxin [Microcystis sp. M179S2]MCA2699331.1 type II toxin-antitoxin system RelE/ParE family toxin [Microcystis sp. M179S2]NCQ91076.1 type II toxin-antitoxin system RelE/ParE family toxin [Microcystis aeruginosa LG13-13]NCR62509.1 type II toxin-antitoxin system RelE/ParE family toxin [Microcystis aeruginosa LG11-05]NCR70600.1 type II toxin-antitoxin system RelE/ParE family toxin [Microcystis aeruginosa LG13-12]